MVVENHTEKGLSLELLIFFLTFSFIMLCMKVRMPSHLRG